MCLSWCQESAKEEKQYVTTLTMLKSEFRYETIVSDISDMSAAPIPHLLHTLRTREV